MTPRAEVREVPTTPRYFAVDLDGRGLHHFRLPTYSDAAVLFELFEIDPFSDLVLWAGMAVGLCWWHRGYDLDTPIPPGRSAGALAAYSRAVQDELLDARDPYARKEFMAMGYAISEHIAGFLREVDDEAVGEVLGNGEAATSVASTSG